MVLEKILNEKQCVFLSSRTKSEVLHELIDCSENVRDKEGLIREIFYREQLMSTGIGQGIGVPHVRFQGVDDPQIIVGLKKEGIPDYASIDNQIVKIVIMVLVGKDQHKEYLRILSLLVGRLKDPEIANGVLNANSPAEIRAALAGEISS